MPIAPGTRLGPYVVQESIGQGAMGVVYRAYHAQLERTGAVKVLQALSPDADTTARFRREAQAIAQMRHPNVLNVYDFGEYEGTPYMIVEYVEAGSLAGRLKHEMTPAQALHYLRGIGSALDYAHSLGIVHRDVKPANVLLGRNDTAILADFGLAKLLQSASIKSATGVTTGTPAYMAPEQVEGSQVGPPADRYSLAVMAFEMLTSSLPFDDVGVLEVLYAHVHREPPRPSTRNTTLTSRVDAIVLRGLAKDPKSRWESCEAFVSALEHAMLPAPREAERTIAYSAPAVASVTPPAVTPVQAAVATSPAALVAPAAASAAPSPAVAVAAPQQKRSRRGRWIALGAAAVILVLLVVSIGLFVASRAPTIDLRPSTVAAGGHVTVIATHVPKDQAGTIELHSSVERVYAFRADSSGNVSRDIDIPVDAAIGNHEVDICWNGTCRAHRTLQVVPQVALLTPGTSPSLTPSATASPSPSASHSDGASPSPKATATPRSNPSPSPAQTPSQSPISSPTITVSPSTGVVPGATTITVTGANFPQGTGTLSFTQGGTAQGQGFSVPSSGSFTKTTQLSLTKPWVPGKVTVAACVSNKCASTTISVT